MVVSSASASASARRVSSPWRRLSHPWNGSDASACIPPKTRSTARRTSPAFEARSTTRPGSASFVHAPPGRRRDLLGARARRLPIPERASRNDAVAPSPIAGSALAEVRAGLSRRNPCPGDLARHARDRPAGAHSRVQPRVAKLARRRYLERSRTMTVDERSCVTPDQSPAPPCRPCRHGGLGGTDRRETGGACVARWAGTDPRPVRWR